MPAPKKDFTAAISTLEFGSEAGEKQARAAKEKPLAAPAAERPNVTRNMIFRPEDEDAVQRILKRCRDIGDPMTTLSAAIKVAIQVSAGPDVPDSAIRAALDGLRSSDRRRGSRKKAT